MHRWLFADRVRLAGRVNNRPALYNCLCILDMNGAVSAQLQVKENERDIEMRKGRPGQLPDNSYDPNRLATRAPKGRNVKDDLPIHLDAPRAIQLMDHVSHGQSIYTTYREGVFHPAP